MSMVQTCGSGKVVREPDQTEHAFLTFQSVHVTVILFLPVYLRIGQYCPHFHPLQHILRASQPNLHFERDMKPLPELGDVVNTLRHTVDELHYNQNECRKLVDHVEAFITLIKEEGYTQVLLDQQQRLFE